MTEQLKPAWHTTRGRDHRYTAHWTLPNGATGSREGFQTRELAFEFAGRASKAAWAPRPEIMRHFATDHLAGPLADVSKPFGELAEGLLRLPEGAERSVALRKLLEAKDAAVRAALPRD